MPVLDLRAILPTGFSWRELWLPEQINGLSLPSAVAGGHPLTLTNASKKTTADGVHGDGSANSNINCGAIHNAEAKWWFSFRFKLDSTFVGGLGDMFLFGKRLSDNDWIFLYLVNGDGALHFRYQFGGATAFNIQSAESSWTAGTSYHVLASISSVNAVRMRINNGVAITNADVNPAPNGGDVIIGHRVTATAGGIKGVITDFYMGTDDLTAEEELDLYQGVPPADATEVYLCDTGRGSTVDNRGSSGAGANGTLGPACTWAFGSCQRPVLSSDTITTIDQATATGVIMKEPLSLIVAMKMKENLNGLTLADGRRFVQFFIDGTNFVQLLYDRVATRIDWDVRTSAGYLPTYYTGFPAIDDYVIMVGTLSSGGISRLYFNGSLTNSAVGLAPLSAAGSTANLLSGTAGGCSSNKILFCGLANGAFNPAEAKMVSRRINAALKLGLVI